MSWLVSWLRQPHYKLLSFALAMAAWLYVQGEQVVEAKVRANLAWTLPEGLTSVEPLPGAVQLTLTGSRAAVRRAEHANVRMTIDLSDASAGETGLEFASFPVAGLPPNVSLVGYSPSSMRFVLDEVSTRKVKIEARTVGDPAPGYVISGVMVSPSVVGIRGPRTAVADLLVVSTKPIDVSGLTRDTLRPVELDLPRTVDVLAETPPQASIQVHPMLERKGFSNVPVLVPNNKVWTTDVETVSLTLEGPSAALRSITEQDLAVRVDLPDNPSRDRYEAPYGPQVGPHLKVLLPRPDEVRVVSLEPATIEVYRR